MKRLVPFNLTNSLCFVLTLTLMYDPSAWSFSINNRFTKRYSGGDGGDDDGTNPFHHLSSVPILLASISTTTSTSTNNSPNNNFFSRLFQRKPKEPPPKPPITSITISPNSTILPSSVIHQAITSSQLIGSTQPETSIVEFARIVTEWYRRNGYVLHSVEGANISETTGECTIRIREPTVSSQPSPVQFTFAKEMVRLDDGRLLSPQQFRRREKELKLIKTPREDWNTTFLELSNGKTRPNVKWSNGLGLIPNKAFRWSEEKWKRCMLQSGVFKQILDARPVTLEDGSVQLQVVAEEAPSRSLEYGLSSSLYTGTWEGEVDFEQRNVFGSAESIGLTFRRGATDPEPSLRIFYKDPKFGLKGGYDVELFNDYIGVQDDDVEDVNDDDDDDRPVLRRGGTVHFRNLNAWNQPSNARVGIERVGTKQEGFGEDVLGAMLEVGPFVRDVGDEGGKWSYRMKMDTGGRRFSKKNQRDEKVNQPYGGIMGTVRHLLPLLGNRMTLAFEHRAGTSANLPRHEAQAIGVGARVRGYPATCHGAVKRLVLGKNEIRIPFEISSMKHWNQDASLVVFADWIFADAVGGRDMSKQPMVYPGKGGAGSARGKQRDEQTMKEYSIKRNGLFRKSSVGIGFRKSIQGIPIKYDLSLTQEGNVAARVGIGIDFDV